MRTFVSIIDEGGFASAARALDVAPAAVTRLLSDLEAHLGTRLIHRSTRRLALTDIGAQYLDRARAILANVSSAEGLASRLMRRDRLLSASTPSPLCTSGGWHRRERVASLAERFDNDLFWLTHKRCW
jgi:DNA-binding transcriptional LysR family regulator